MYHTESMIQMMEDMQRQAAEMEKNVKDMMEMEGRAWGIELDKRKNARDLMDELMEAQSSNESAPTDMTWAYVPNDVVEYDNEPCEWGNDMHSPWAGYDGEMLTETDLWHEEDHIQE